MGEQFQTIDQVKASAIDMAVKFGPKLVVAGLILFVGYLAARWAGNMLCRVLARFKLEPPVRALLEREWLEPADRVSYLRSDICRSDLNLEIEATLLGLAPV